MMLLPKSRLLIHIIFFWMFLEAFPLLHMQTHRCYNIRACFLFHCLAFAILDACEYECFTCLHMLACVCVCLCSGLCVYVACHLDYCRFQWASWSQGQTRRKRERTREGVKLRRGRGGQWVLPWIKWERVKIGCGKQEKNRVKQQWKGGVI